MNKNLILYDAVKYTKIVYNEKYGMTYAYIQCPFCFSSFEGSSPHHENFVLLKALLSLEEHLEKCDQARKAQ